MIHQKFWSNTVCHALIASILSLMIFSCCNNPVDWDESALIEFESAWQYLKAYSIYQDSSIYDGRIPSDPFQFDSLSEMFESVNDTLKGNNYTGYYVNSDPNSMLAKVNDTKESLNFVWFDTLTSNTLLLKIRTFTSFDSYDYVGEQFLSSLKSIGTASDFEYMVIDLRGNGGGDLSVHEKILNEFLSSGDKYILARERVYDSEANPKFYTKSWHPWTASGSMHQALRNKRFVILVDGYTASASEIFASAMRRCRGATIIGKGNTYGKAMGQIRVARRNRPSLQITCLQLREMNNNDYQNVGLEPDILIESGVDELLQAVKVNEPEVTSLRMLRKPVGKMVTENYRPACIYRTIYEESLE